MDSSSEQTPVDSSDRCQLESGRIRHLAEQTISGGVSLTGTSNIEVKSEGSPRNTVASDSEKSVHIIFLRGDSESSSNSDSIEVEETSQKCDGNESLIRLSPVLTPMSPSSSVTSSSHGEIKEHDGVQSWVSFKKMDEVEDDFDISEEVMFLPRKRPLGESHSRKKKKFFKECKACGELVERQDLLSHIKEHRSRKLELASSTNNKINVPAEEKMSSHPLATSDSARTHVSSADCKNLNDNSIPTSSLDGLPADRPFKCSMCSEAFRTESGLTIHFKSHSGECSNSCPVS